MSEKYITVFYHEYPKSSDDNSITSYLSNYIRKQIRESKNKSDEEKDILLNWPIVYAHAWRRNSGEIRIYVGETNDLAQRIGQHAIVDQFFFDELMLSHHELSLSAHEFSKILCIFSMN